MQPVRILHVVGAMNRAGTETMLMNIYRNLDRDKVQFDFVSYKPDAHYDEEIKMMGGKIIRLSKAQSFKELYQAIKKHGPYQAVHSHTLFHCGLVNAAAKLAGVKVRISHAHTTSDKSDTFIRKIYINTMRILVNSLSTNLLACSKAAGRYLFGEKTARNPGVAFFPNLIDYPQFLNTQKKEVNKFKIEQGLANSIVIGHIGRFIEAKNHRFLLDIIQSAAKIDKTVNLLLVGDGDLRLQMEAAAKEKGIHDRVRFVGLRKDIPIMLHAMDIFVFPSIYEGLGLVLLEAQACGLPCVVSEAIQPEADLNIGLVTRLALADGPDKWADKILQLAGQKEHDLSKIGNSFETNGYSLPAGISKLLDIYQVAMEDI